MAEQSSANIGFEKQIWEVKVTSIILKSKADYPNPYDFKKYSECY